MKLHFNIIIFVICFVGGCSEHFPNQPLLNQPPDTYLTLMPDSTLRSTTSQQHVHWWGVDPDGFVKGYFISLDSLIWTFTTSNDSILGLRISTTDTTYKFFVAAVDDQGLRDPKPASLQYPIHNSPPVVSFISQSDVPDTTFTVATFQWNSFDLDGNESIVAYYYALDDTTSPSNWKSLASNYSRVMLRKSDGLIEGRHIFYLKARDIAGAYSQTIRMPIDTTKTWYVKDPEGKSDFLIIRDWIWGDDGAASYYSHTIDSVMGGRLNTAYVWDIKAGWSNTTRGKYVPALINPTFTESIKLFKYILWYADNDPQLDIAQASLPAFESAGGKILFTTGFPQYPLIDSRGFGDFAPIDNIENYYFTNILQANIYSKTIGDSIVAVDTTYPRLYRDFGSLGNGVACPRGILPKGNAKIIYKMGNSQVAPPSGWSDRNTNPIIMGVKDADQPSIIFLAFSLNRFSGHESGGKPFIPNNASAFLRKVFYDEFGVR